MVDIYQGRNYPSKFESDNFFGLVKAVLSNEGSVVFNRLYASDVGARKSAVVFGDKLEKKFSEVKRIFPLANLVFICKR